MRFRTDVLFLAPFSPPYLTKDTDPSPRSADRTHGDISNPGQRHFVNLARGGLTQIMHPGEAAMSASPANTCPLVGLGRHSPIKQPVPHPTSGGFGGDLRTGENGRRTPPPDNRSGLQRDRSGSGSSGKAKPAEAGRDVPHPGGRQRI